MGTYEKKIDAEMIKRILTEKEVKKKEKEEKKRKKKEEKKKKEKEAKEEDEEFKRLVDKENLEMQAREEAAKIKNNKGNLGSLVEAESHELVPVERGEKPDYIPGQEGAYKEGEAYHAEKQYRGRGEGEAEAYAKQTSQLNEMKKAEEEKKKREEEKRKKHHM
jgi:hypothetical protein